MNKQREIEMKTMNSMNKKGISQIQGFIVTLGIILLLIIFLFIFLGDTSSGIKEMINNIFG